MKWLYTLALILPIILCKEQLQEKIDQKHSQNLTQLAQQQDLQNNFNSLSSSLIQDSPPSPSSPVDLIKQKLQALQGSMALNQQVFDKVKGQQSQFDIEINDLQKVVNESIDKQDSLNTDIQKIVDYYNHQREAIEDLLIETNKKAFSNNQNIDQIFEQGNIHATFEDNKLQSNNKAIKNKL